MTLAEAAEKRCPQCLAQQRFAGTYASPNEDVMCGFHTSELRKYLFALRERVEALAKDLERPYEPGLDALTAKGMARRLRETLAQAESKPGAEKGSP